MIDLQRGHAWRVLRGNLARRIQDRIHLSKNMQARLKCLFKRTLHDLFIDAFDLDVHLQGGHTLRGTGDLEVHIAQMILVTENVCQDGELIALFHQTHRDTSNRRRERHPCGHHGERAYTYRCH